MVSQLHATLSTRTQAAVAAAEGSALLFASTFVVFMMVT